MIMRPVQSECDGLLFAYYKRWILAAYTMGMLLTSVIPMNHQRGGAPFWAKLDPSAQNMLHVPMFLVFVFLLSRVWANGVAGIYMRWVAVMGVSILFSIMLESIQLIIPGRYPSFTDVLLNMLGASLGCLVLIALGCGRQEKAEPKNAAP